MTFLFFFLFLNRQTNRKIKKSEGKENIEIIPRKPDRRAERDWKDSERDKRKASKTEPGERQARRGEIKREGEMSRDRATEPDTFPLSPPSICPSSLSSPKHHHSFPPPFTYCSFIASHLTCMLPLLCSTYLFRSFLFFFRLLSF